MTNKLTPEQIAFLVSFLYEEYSVTIKAEDVSPDVAGDKGEYLIRVGGNNPLFVIVYDDFSEGISEDTDVVTYPSGEYIFAITTDEDIGTMFSVNPKTYWEKEKCLYDRHISIILEMAFGIDLEDMGAYELTENLFEADSSEEEIVDNLTKAGLTRSPELEKFLGRT